MPKIGTDCQHHYVTATQAIITVIPETTMGVIVTAVIVGDKHGGSAAHDRIPSWMKSQSSPTSESA